MISELNNDADYSSRTLLASMIDQVPKMHNKFIKDFNSLYRTGTWIALLPKINIQALDSHRSSISVGTTEKEVEAIYQNNIHNW